MKVAYMHTAESISADKCQCPPGHHHAGELMINEPKETDFLDDILYTVVTLVSCVG